MVKSGDIFSIGTAKGTAYFQFVKKVGMMGALIRVFSATYQTPPSDWNALVGQNTNFWVFFPVAAASKKGVVQKVANCEVPESARSTPIFRAGIPDPDTGKVDTWWLWDGEREWPVGTITEEQRRLPIRASWNDTLLVQRIEEGWLPEKDSR